MVALAPSGSRILVVDGDGSPLGVRVATFDYLVDYTDLGRRTLVWLLTLFLPEPWIPLT